MGGAAGPKPSVNDPVIDGAALRSPIIDDAMDRGMRSKAFAKQPTTTFYE